MVGFILISKYSVSTHWTPVVKFKVMEKISKTPYGFLNYWDPLCQVFPLPCDQASIKNTKFSYFILTKNEPLVQIFHYSVVSSSTLHCWCQTLLTTLHATSFLPGILLPKYCTQTSVFNWMHFKDTLRLSDMTWHDTTQHDVTWHDTTWHDMTWHDTTWHDMTWLGPFQLLM